MEKDVGDILDTVRSLQGGRSTSLGTKEGRLEEFGRLRETSLAEGKLRTKEAYEAMLSKVRGDDRGVRERVSGVLLVSLPFFSSLC